MKIYKTSKIATAMLCFTLLTPVTGAYAGTVSSEQGYRDDVKSMLNDFSYNYTITYEGTDQSNFKENYYKWYTSVLQDAELNNHLLEGVNVNGYYTGGSNPKSTLNFTTSYWNGYNGEEHAKVLAFARSISSQLQGYNLSDYEKVVILNNLMCELYHYDLSLSEYAPYGLMVNKSGVCNSYATLFYILAIECGLNVKFVTGTLDGGPHLWNAVLVNGAWYNIDVTNNDTDVILQNGTPTLAISATLPPINVSNIDIDTLSSIQITTYDKFLLKSDSTLYADGFVIQEPAGVTISQTDFPLTDVVINQSSTSTQPQPQVKPPVQPQLEVPQQPEAQTSQEMLSVVKQLSKPTLLPTDLKKVAGVIKELNPEEQGYSEVVSMFESKVDKALNTQATSLNKALTKLKTKPAKEKLVALNLLSTSIKKAQTDFSFIETPILTDLAKKVNTLVQSTKRLICTDAVIKAERDKKLKSKQDALTLVNKYGIMDLKARILKIKVRV